MRNFIGLKTILGYSVAEAIRQFQEKKNYPEDIWSYEAIKKDIDRNTTIKRCNDVDDFLELMDREIKQRISDSMEELNKTECREVGTK
jgi:predicted RNase H-like nuclease (RuvC/YqgF family)